MTEAARSGPALIIGAGLMGQWHAHAVVRSGGRIVGVVDPDIRRAKTLAIQWSAPGFSDLKSALDQDEASVVHVCTPAETHLDLALECIDSGRNLLVEKPAFPTVDATRQVLELANSAQLQVVPVLQFPFQDGFLRLQHALPELGPIRLIRGTACSAGSTGMSREAAWAISLGIFPHFASMVQRLIAAPVDAISWRGWRHGEADLHASAVAGDALVAVDISMAGRPTRTTLEVVAENGSMYLDLFHGFALREDPRVSRGSKIARPFRQGWLFSTRAPLNLARRALRREPAYPGLRRLVRRFHEASRSGSTPPYTPTQVIEMASALEKLEEAIR